MLNINDISRIYLGIQGENGIRTIDIDVSDWAEGHPDASFSIWHKRNGDEVPSPTGAAYNPETMVVSWTPTSTDTYVSGEGEAEIRMTENTVIKKTKAVITGVSPSVTGAGEPLGSDWQSYIDEVDRIKSLAVAAAADAEDGAEDAEAYAVGTRGGEDVPDTDPTYHNNSKYYAEQAWGAVDKGPIIQGGTWRIWDVSNGQYVDTGIPATGPQGAGGPAGPQGATGNGISSITIDDEYCLTFHYTNGGTFTTGSIRGPQGGQGVQGIQGPRGLTGPAGVSIVNIALNADYTLTFTMSDGQTYTTGSVRGPAGATGATGPAGQDGQNGTNGQDGADGTSYYVHIKYSANEPSQDSDMKTNPDAWMGIYSGSSSTAPSTYTSYVWYKIKGEDGQDGTDGQDGQDGQDGVSAYVHIKYSHTQPTQDSDMKATADDWMGIYAGTSSTAPTAYTSYTWYKIKGDPGIPTVTSADNGKFLRVVNGEWAVADISNASGVSF